MIVAIVQQLCALFCETKLNQFKSQSDKSEQVTSFVYSLRATHNRMCVEMRGKKTLIGETILIPQRPRILKVNYWLKIIMHTSSS